MHLFKKFRVIEAKHPKYIIMVNHFVSSQIIIFIILLRIHITTSTNVTIRLLPTSPSNSNVTSTNKTLYVHPITMSKSTTRIYSNQLDPSILTKVFKVNNNSKNIQKIVLTSQYTHRPSLCANLKYCQNNQKSSYQCNLSLNLIFYSFPVPRVLSYISENDASSIHYSQIKSVHINLIVSDFTGDSLHFKESRYNFELNSESLMRLVNRIKNKINYQNNFFLVGYVKAELNLNIDFNTEVRYYLDFNADTKSELIELFNVNAENGELSLNREKFLKNSKNLFNRELEFFVDAQVQCAGGESGGGILRRRQLIRVYVVDYESLAAAERVQVTQLVETSQLAATYECIQLNSKELLGLFLNTRIALAQVR